MAESAGNLDDLSQELSTDVPAKPLTYWFNYLKKHYWIYIIGIATILVCNMLQVFTTRAMGWILDFFTERKIPDFFVVGDRRETFMMLFWSLIVGKLILAVARWGWRVTLARQTHFAAYEMRLSIWDRVRFLPEKMLQEHFTKGAILNLTNSDVGMARFLFGFILVGAIDLLFLGIMALISMWLIDPYVTIMTILILSPLPFFIKILADKEITRYREVQDHLGDFNEMGAQAVSTIKLQRLTQSGEYWRKHLDRFAQQYRLKRWRAVKVSMRFIPAMGVGSLGAYVVLFWIGAKRVVDGHISIGDFVGLQGLAFLLQDPLMNIGFVISDWRKGMASLERLIELYRSPVEASLLNKDKPLHGETTSAAIVARDLSIQGHQDRSLVDSMDLTVARGERLGIIGKVGTGKSSLINVLAGLRPNSQGDISILGKPLSEWGHQQLRQQVAVVSQRPFLFAMNIRDNLCLGENYSEQEIWRVLEICGIDREIESLPDRLDTFLGEWGINLSGGQKQRLTIARALIRRPKILFLDDCLSAVDTVTEEHILAQLDQHLKDVTVIWAAHRPSTLRYCHKILELPYVSRQ